MLTLALDQSTSSTGYCLINSNEEIVKYGVWDTSNDGDKTDIGHTKKRASLKKYIKELLNEFPKIIQVVCEGTYQSNADVYKKLCKVQGTVEDICYELNIPCFSFVNAGEWRKYLPVKITGKRDVVKEQTKIYVLSVYPELPNDLEQDIYDAIAIGLAYLHMTLL